MAVDLKEALFPIKRLCLFALIVFGFFSQAAAEDSLTNPFSVISKLRNAIYTTGELTGGSDAEWRSLEEAASAEMISALESLEPNSPFLVEQGSTPLHLAAGQGFYFLVEIILSDEKGGIWINSVDQHGLTAYDYAQIALPESLLACHPNIDNPFVLVPFLVKLPYYESRAPFPSIHTALTEAGAETATQSAKKLWLSKCTQSDPILRAKINESENLYATLKEISSAALRERAKFR